MSKRPISHLDNIVSQPNKKTIFNELYGDNSLSTDVTLGYSFSDVVESVFDFNMKGKISVCLSMILDEAVEYLRTVFIGNTCCLRSFVDIPYSHHVFRDVKDGKSVKYHIINDHMVFAPLFPATHPSDDMSLLLDQVAKKHEEGWRMILEETNTTQLLKSYSGFMALSPYWVDEGYFKLVLYKEYKNQKWVDDAKDSLLHLSAGNCLSRNFDTWTEDNFYNNFKEYDAVNTTGSDFKCGMRDCNRTIYTLHRTIVDANVDNPLYTLPKLVKYLPRDHSWDRYMFHTTYENINVCDKCLRKREKAVDERKKMLARIE